MDLAAGVDRALRRAGIPIVSVSIGNTSDRGTWRVVYANSATSEDRIAAAVILAVYDPLNDTALKDEDAAQAIDGQRMLKAFAIWTAGKLNIPVGTMRTQVIAIYKSLN